MPTLISCFSNKDFNQVSVVNETGSQNDDKFLPCLKDYGIPKQKLVGSLLISTSP